MMERMGQSDELEAEPPVYGYPQPYPGLFVRRALMDTTNFGSAAPTTSPWLPLLREFREAIQLSPEQIAEDRQLVEDALRRVHGNAVPGAPPS